VVLQCKFARLLDEYVDNRTFGRREQHLVDELLVLDAATVSTDQFHLSTRQPNVEHACAGGVRQPKSNYLSDGRDQVQVRVAGPDVTDPLATGPTLRFSVSPSASSNNFGLPASGSPDGSVGNRSC
jgi:hypothetical protein